MVVVNVILYRLPFEVAGAVTNILVLVVVVVVVVLLSIVLTLLLSAIS